MHQIVLADDKQVLKKTNIDLIQLIEKTGGFHDGLVLVINTGIAPLVATLFIHDFVKNAFKDPIQSSEDKMRRKKLANWLESQGDASELLF